MLRDTQKIIIHVYQRAARLSDPVYRDILHAHAGMASAADPEFTQSGYEQVMAALETVLFERVDTGEVPDPIGRSRYIHDRNYWRNKANRQSGGRVNSRQYDLIMRLWTQLGEWQEDSERTPEYFAGIVARATGKTDIGVSALTSSQAWCVIEALKSRLAHALKTANKQTVEMPF